MRSGWYQRYKNEYARLRNNGASHEEARKAAIAMLRNE